jgi:O-antigen ligase
LANLISFLIGYATWDTMVPRSDRFIVVQLAQWLIYVFSAFAFWLSSYLIVNRSWLWWLTGTYLLVAGLLALAFIIPTGTGIVWTQATIAISRAPFWLLLAALAGGQLLFNGDLSKPWRVFLIILLVGVTYYAFIAGRESASNWLAVGSVIIVLLSFRWPRFRWLALIIILVLAIAGILVPTIWNFAGGDLEWQISGGSRLLLAERVLDVTMRNPIIGLGPAAYRNYAAMTPLPYLGAFWTQPRISSHNNYVDIFSHAGIIGLVLFFWFVAEMFALILRLRSKYKTGFEAGYVNGMLAAGTGALAIMLLADWLLPFVYNIGFPGFQASVLVWLFLGGLVALERMAGASDET